MGNLELLSHWSRSLNNVINLYRAGIYLLQSIILEIWFIYNLAKNSGGIIKSPAVPYMSQASSPSLMVILPYFHVV